MAVTELWTGSAISQGGSLLYVFIAANANPTVGFFSQKWPPTIKFQMIGFFWAVRLYVLVYCFTEAGFHCTDLLMQIQGALTNPS